MEKTDIFNFRFCSFFPLRLLFVGGRGSFRIGSSDMITKLACNLVCRKSNDETFSEREKGSNIHIYIVPLNGSKFSNKLCGASISDMIS